MIKKEKNLDRWALSMQMVHPSLIWKLRCIYMQGSYCGCMYTNYNNSDSKTYYNWVNKYVSENNNPPTYPYDLEPVFFFFKDVLEYKSWSYVTLLNTKCKNCVLFDVAQMSAEGQTTYFLKTRHRHKYTSQRFSAEFILWRIHLTTKTRYQNQTGLEHPLSLMKFPSEIYCAFIKTGSKVASEASGYSWVILVQAQAITKIFNALKRQLWQNLFCLKIKRSMEQ